MTTRNNPPMASAALLVLRVVLGIILAAHG